MATSTTPMDMLKALAPLPGLAYSAASAATAPSAAPPTADGPSWLQTETATIVTILLGVILIIAGLFQFRQVREVSTAALAA